MLNAISIDFSGYDETNQLSNVFRVDFDSQLALNWYHLEAVVGGYMKISISITRKAILSLVVVSVIGTAAAALTLFTHTFPPVPVTTAVLTSACPNANLFTSPSMVLTSSSGTVIGKCSSTQAAFTASPGTVTPSFSFATGSPYTALGILPDPGGAAGCTFASPTSTVTITSGTPITFATTPTTGQLATGPYSYCASYTTTSTTTSLDKFSVSWSQ